LTNPPITFEGYLQLGFVKRGRTILESQEYSWPYTIGRRFYLDDDPNLVTVIIQSVSGTINAGDVLRQKIHVAAGSRVKLMPQGAVSVHRGSSPSSASESLELVIERAGYVEHLAECRILFPGSEFCQRIAINAAPGGAALVVDAFVAAVDTTGAGFESYSSTVTVECEGEVLVRENVRLDNWPLLGTTARNGGFTSYALVMLAAPGRDWNGDADDYQPPERNPLNGLYFAVSKLPNGAGIAARIAARDGRLLREGIASCVEHLRSLADTPNV
jgi:urease accessory protein